MMQQFKQKLFVLPVALLVVSLFAVPVYAHGDEDHSGSGNGSSDSTGSVNPNGQSTVKIPSERQKQSEAEFHSRGEKIVEEAKKERHGGKSKDDLKKLCQTRKAGIQNRTSAIAGHAQTSLKRINDVFTKVTAYKESADLTVENFDTLVATASVSKEKATASVEALVALNPDINCDSENVTTDIATFKAAVKQAHTDLVAYRKDVKAILSTVMSAKQTARQGEGQ